MKLDKALVWMRRGKNVAPTPWWKRPIEWLAALRSGSSGSKLPDPRAVASKLPDPEVVASKLPDPRAVASKLPDPQAVASKLPDPQAVASNRWARGVAAAGVTTAATVVVVRRRRDRDFRGHRRGDRSFADARQRGRPFGVDPHSGGGIRGFHTPGRAGRRRGTDADLTAVADPRSGPRQVSAFRPGRVSPHNAAPPRDDSCMQARVRFQHGLTGTGTMRLSRGRI
jgi:hypothetical protein